jgi:hypothetical protein
MSQTTQDLHVSPKIASFCDKTDGNRMIYVVPKSDFELAGTDIVIKKGVPYAAVLATNQPDWEKDGKVFVNDILLARGDYDALTTPTSTGIFIDANGDEIS